MNWELTTFIFYGFIAASTTIYVGQTLYRHGAVFLERIFYSHPRIVASVNKLLLLGYYLINLGFVLAYFSQKHEIRNGLECLEFLATKLGTVYLLLGTMHLFNLLVFVAIEQYSINKFLTEHA